MGTHGALAILLWITTTIVTSLVHAQPQPQKAKGTNGSATQQESLLGSARIWKMRGNIERERADLLKLLAGAADHPVALFRLGLLEIRAEKIDVATKLLKRLKTKHPNDSGVAPLEDALRIAGVDRGKMAQVQLLARFGRNEEAATTMRALFPGGSPGGDLAVTYYRIIGNSQSGWDEARRAFENLCREEPDNTRLQLAQALHQTIRAETRQAGMNSLALLAKHPDIDRQAVLDAWERALVTLDRTPEHISMYLAYIEADPRNFPIRDALSDAKRVEADRRPWMLRDSAKVLLKEGKADLAESTLKEALQLDPKNPWVRFDLSRLAHARGSRQEGRDLMAKGRALAPDEPDMHYAEALYMGLLDEAAEALVLLNKIPASQQSPSMQALGKKLGVQSHTQRALSLARASRRAEALAAMKLAEATAGNDTELGFIAASAWLELGDTARGLSLMRSLVAQQLSPAVSTRLLYAEILNRAGQDEELAALLDILSSTEQATGTDHSEFRYLQSSLAARQADSRRNAGDYAGAQSGLEKALEKDPDNTDMLMALARIHSARRAFDRARGVYERILARAPKYLNARLALARTNHAAGDRTAANREIATILAESDPANAEVRLDIADACLDIDNTAAARRIIDLLEIAMPDNPRVLVMAGRLARSEGNPGKAMEYFRKAKADDEIAQLNRGRKPLVVASGFDSLSKAGTPGISNLKSIELPMALRFPVGYAGQALVHVDPVRISAGNLPLDDIDNLRRYGKIFALARNGIAHAPTQSASGVALAAGYEIGGLSFDIGTTPLGFPVTDVVGGIKLYRSNDAYSYSVEFARRPVTSSLLAFAGAFDPVSGQVWGGVRRIGFNGNLGYKGEQFDAFATVGAYQLSGKNVSANNEFALRTGLEWKLLQRETMRLTLGLAFTHWRFRENLSNYTFGHGGYYSPQSYYSIAFQPRWTGRKAEWSYLLHGSVSASASHEKDMPYYPNDPELQATGNAIYPGGSSRGKGHSVGGALEYRLTPRLFMGGRFSVDRSAYYTPNFAGLYLRFQFNAPGGAVPFPPDPIKPYSRF